MKNQTHKLCLIQQQTAVINILNLHISLIPRTKIFSMNGVINFHLITFQQTKEMHGDEFSIVQNFQFSLV